MVVDAVKRDYNSIYNALKDVYDGQAQLWGSSWFRNCFVYEALLGGPAVYKLEHDSLAYAVIAVEAAAIQCEVLYYQAR